ncbi:hypothetical protein AUP68_06574 [Ilyonectria robusta]
MLAAPPTQVLSIPDPKPSLPSRQAARYHPAMAGIHKNPDSSSTMKSIILSWLDGIPKESPAHIAEPYASKRRRLNLPTPNSSTVSYENNTAHLNMPPTRKLSPFKRSEHGNAETPRSKSDRSENDLEPSEISLTSRRSSPSKQIRALRHRSDGIEYRELSDFIDKPASLLSLLDDIDNTMEGQGIISPSEITALSQAAKDYNADFRWAAKGNLHYFSEKRDRFGQTPSVEDVLRILDKAVECSQGDHAEDSWNKSVHAPLLELAFHPRGQRIKDQFISATSWSVMPISILNSQIKLILTSIHASILPDYGSPSTTKKVDFCVYVNPSNETRATSVSISPAVPSIERLCRELPGQVFNFTDFAPLERRPIALSIETKKPGEGCEGARLQLGVWQMGHWGFLKYLIEIQEEKRQARRAEAVLEAEQAEAEGNTGVVQQSVQSLSLHEEQQRSAPESTQETVRPLRLPEFLPGIIIQGHQWDLVITTLDGAKTKFWHKLPMGNTLDTKGIYKLVCSLQILRTWAEESYWPWLKELVMDEGQLGMATDDTQVSS